jgi:hypothetical protein
VLPFVTNLSISASLSPSRSTFPCPSYIHPQSSTSTDLDLDTCGGGGRGGGGREAVKKRRRGARARECTRHWQHSTAQGNASMPVRRVCVLMETRAAREEGIFGKETANLSRRG